MAKKYTFMILNEDRMGKIRSFSISQRTIIFSFIIFFAVLGTFGFSAYKLFGVYFNDGGEHIVYNADNIVVYDQLEHYNSQLQEIAEKINQLDDLEFRIRDLMALQEGNTQLKPVAVGGKEVDLLREYASAAELSEKAFFETLDKTLKEFSYEVDAKEHNLADLAASLEEKRMVMLYTPTVWPVQGWLSSTFGYRVSPFSGRQTFHDGIDIAARYGSSVVATAKGTVVYAGFKAGYGQLVTIDHGYGYITRYGHNSSVAVKVGDKVEKGQIIAKVGSTGQSTGPHVHYEVLVGGIPVNPLKFIIEDRM